MFNGSSWDLENVSTVMNKGIILAGGFGSLTFNDTNIVDAGAGSLGLSSLNLTNTSSFNSNLILASAISGAGSGSLSSLNSTEVDIIISSGSFLSCAHHLGNSDDLSSGQSISCEYIFGIVRINGSSWDLENVTFVVNIAISLAGCFGSLTGNDTNIVNAGAGSLGLSSLNLTNTSSVNSNLILANAIVHTGHSSLNSFVLSNVKSSKLRLV